jgi:hypothetical protein
MAPLLLQPRDLKAILRDPLQEYNLGALGALLIPLSFSFYSRGPWNFNFSYIS